MTDKPLNNPQLVAVVVYLLGGDVRHVDTEDVAVRTSELVPGRFVWRKYEDQIDLDRIRRTLIRSRQPEYGSLLTGDVGRGWLLTPVGLDFAKRNLERIPSEAVRPARPPRHERRWKRTEEGRIMICEAVTKARQGKTEMITTREAEAVFRLNDYVTGQDRKDKITKYLNAFADDEELGPALRSVAALLMEDVDEQ